MKGVAQPARVNCESAWPLASRRAFARRHGGRLAAASSGSSTLSRIERGELLAAASSSVGAAQNAGTGALRGRRARGAAASPSRRSATQALIDIASSSAGRRCG